MNGNFEANTSAYPIGYLKSGMLYQVVYMPTLEPLDKRAVRQANAVQIASSLNARWREGEFQHIAIAPTPNSHKVDWRIDLVRAAVTEAIDAVGPGNIPEGAVA